MSSQETLKSDVTTTKLSGDGTGRRRPRNGGPTQVGPPIATSARKRKSLVWLLRALILAALLVVWQWYGTVTGGVFVPSMTDTFGAFPDLISSGTLVAAIWQSNIALLVGYPLSVILGLALGFLIGRNRTADRGLSYWLDIAMVIPMVALVPVVVVALGLNLSARVAVVLLFAMPVIAINARAAVRVVNNDLLEMAQAFEASPKQKWTSVILPSAVSGISAGLRIGIGRAISGMIIIELTLVPVGLGGLLFEFKSSFSAGALYAVTAVVILEGVLLTSAAHAIENRVMRRMTGGA